MMRNYSKAIFASLFSMLVITSGIIASAQNETEWKAMRNGVVLPTSQKPMKVKSMSETVRKGLGIRTAGSQIAPSKDGMRPTPKVSQKPNNLLRSPENPRGNLYGVINRFPNMEYNSEAFVAKFDMKSGSMTKMYSGYQFCPYIGDDYTLQTNVYRNGAIYSPGQKVEIDGSYQYWTVTDFYSGEIINEFKYNSDACAYTMCYNSDEDKFYAVSINNMSEQYSLLQVIDPNDSKQPFNVIDLADLNSDFRTGFICSIAYNSKDKLLYVFNAANVVYTIEIKNGQLIVAEAGFVDSNDILFEEGVTTPLVYSPADEMFLMVYRDNFLRANRLLYVHPETFEVFEGPLLAESFRPYIASLFVTDDFAEPDAPEVVGKVNVNFTKANLTGKISFTSPEYTYAGVELGETPIKMVVTIDGKEYYNQNVKALTPVSLDVTLEEGSHVLEIVSYNGEFASPKRTVEFYTGYDAPKSPEYLTLQGNTLSWERPGEIGMHNGFVDADDITYNVYLDGKKLNDAPITEEQYVVEPKDAQKVCEFSVEAVSHNHASDKTSLKEVFGSAINLPFFQKPTSVEKDMYRVINHNEDGRMWFWTDETADKGSDMYGWAMSVGYMNAADDWLIFPLINFPDASKLYSIDFDIAGLMLDYTTCESYELYLAKEPTVKAMLSGLCIYKDNYYMTDDGFQHKSYNFAVKEPGDYYIAMRINSTKDTDPSGFGVLVNDFNVKVVDGKSNSLPADPTKVTVIPDPEGYNYFDVEATLPTLDITGKPLPADQVITLKVVANGIEKTGTGKPGETIIVPHGVDFPGFVNIAITPSNEAGDGYTRYHRNYVGIDIPLCPTNIKATASADNLTMHYTWDAPGAIGENNGVVNVDELYYKFYVRSGIALSYIDKTTECKYDFKPFGNQALKQEATLAGSSANNEAGESRYSIFYQDEIGVPYELPVKEEFNSTGFDFSPYRFLVDGEFSQSEVTNVSSMDGAGIDDPKFVQGGLIAYCTGIITDSRAVLPKVTTSGISRTMVSVRVWDYSHAPEVMQIFGRRFEKEEEQLIGEYRFTHPSKGEWVEYELPLPAEFNNCPWIQIRIGCPLKGEQLHSNEYLVIDNYQIYPDLNYDLKITDLNGLAVATPGETATYFVKVANAGRERTSGNLIISAVNSEGKTIASSETPVPMINPYQFFEHEVQFELNGDFMNGESVEIIAKIECDEDDNTNNNTKKISLQMRNSGVPVVTDLVGTPLDDEVELTWSAPQGEYGDFENFDLLTPYQVTDKLGQFKNVNGDDLYPIAIGNGALTIEWPDYEKKQAWTVVNMEDLKLMNDTRMAPHSGKQVLIARAGWYDQEDTPKQSSKWLVSPEVVGGTKISFWVSTPSSSDTEYLEIWTSETGDYLDPTSTSSTRNGNFRKQAPKSKVGSEAWEEISYKLSAKDKYFALRYSSYDGIAILLDDITFTPAQKLAYDIDHYSVYRVDDSGEPVLVADDLKTPGFTDKTWDSTKVATYYVLAHANYDNRVIAGAKSNLVRIAATGVDNISDTQAIYSGKGEIRVDGFEGENITITAADGKVMVNTNVRSAQAHYSVAAGIYVVTCGDVTRKVVVR